MLQFDWSIFVTYAYIVRRSGIMLDIPSISAVMNCQWFAAIIGYWKMSSNLVTTETTGDKINVTMACDPS